MTFCRSGRAKVLVCKGDYLSTNIFFLICGHFSNGWYYYRYQALQQDTRLCLSLFVSILIFFFFFFFFDFSLSEHFNLFRADNNYDRMANRLRQMYNCKVLIRIKKNREKNQSNYWLRRKITSPMFYRLASIPPSKCTFIEFLADIS